MVPRIAEAILQATLLYDDREITFGPHLRFRYHLLFADGLQRLQQR